MRSGDGSHGVIAAGVVGLLWSMVAAPLVKRMFTLSMVAWVSILAVFDGSCVHDGMWVSMHIGGWL